MKWLYCLFCLGVMPHYRGMCHSCGSFNGEQNNELQKMDETVETHAKKSIQRRDETLSEVEHSD